MFHRNFGYLGDANEITFHLSLLRIMSESQARLVKSLHLSLLRIMTKSQFGFERESVSGQGSTHMKDPAELST